LVIEGVDSDIPIPAILKSNKLAMPCLGDIMLRLRQAKVNLAYPVLPISIEKSKRSSKIQSLSD
jgi:hypothetical protein